MNMSKKDTKEMLAAARKKLAKARKIYVEIHEGLWVQTIKKEMKYILKKVKDNNGYLAIDVDLINGDAYITVVVAENYYPDDSWGDDNDGN